MRIRVRNKAYYITKEEIKKKLAKVEPEAGNKYFIKIQNKRYPIKQVISKVFSIPKAEFNSQEAYRILRNLKFKIIDESTG